MSILLILTACGTTVWHEPQTEQPVQGQLLIWHPFEDINAQVFNEALADYERVHAGVRIISEYIPQAQLSQRFIKQFQSGLGPDLMVNFSSEIPALVRAKTLQTLDETAIVPSSYTPQAMTQVYYHGNTYGVPLNGQIRVLCYNRAIVEQPKTSTLKTDKLTSAANLTKETNTIGTNEPLLSAPPTTLQGLIQRARAGYSVGIVSTFIDTFWGIQIFGGQLYEENRQVPKLEGWSRWLTWLNQADDEPNIILEQHQFILHNAFAQSKLSYYVCDSTEIADFKQSLKDNLGVALLPGKPEHPAGPLLYTHVLVLSRNANLVQTQLAYQLVQFLTKPEQQIKSMVQSQDFLPINQGVTVDRHILPIEAILLEQAKTAVSIPLDDLDKIEPIIHKGETLFRKAIIGDITPTEASMQLTQVVNQKFGKP